jgi:hypothetical protein
MEIKDKMKLLETKPHYVLGFVIRYAYDDRWGKMNFGIFIKRRIVRIRKWLKKKVIDKKIIVIILISIICITFAMF